MARIIIVFGLILGIGFWISSKDDEKTNVKSSIKTEKNTEKETKSSESESSSKEESTIIKTEEEAVTNVVSETKTVTQSQQTTVSNDVPAKKEVYTDVSTEVKVFLYEWGIDISEKQINTGKVIFNVVNNGKFTHEFNIKNIKNYGKVLPGETKQFVISLRSGNFEIYSNRRDDYDRDMKEMLSIVQ